jgi:hypothetical protein
MTKDDLQYAREHLDPKLMEFFNYQYDDIRWKKKKRFGWWWDARTGLWFWRHQSAVVVNIRFTKRPYTLCIEQVISSIMRSYSMMCASMLLQIVTPERVPTNK